MNSQLSQLALLKPRERLSVYEAVLLGRRLVTQLDIHRADYIIEALRANIGRYPEEPLTRSVLAAALCVSYSDPQWRHGLLLDEVFENTRKSVKFAPNSPWTITAEGFSAVVHKDRDRLRELGQRVKVMDGGSQMLKGSIGLWMILLRPHMNAYHGEFRETAYCWDLFLLLKALSSKKPFNGPMFSGAKKRWTCFFEPVGALLGLKGDDGRWQLQRVFFDRQNVDA